MRGSFLLLLPTLLIHNGFALTTIVIGNCVPGDYEFNDLREALTEADNGKDVNIVICGQYELSYGKTVEVDDLWMSDGEIRSNYERIKIVGDDITISDLNLVDTFLQIVSTGEVVLRNVRSEVNNARYCIEINTSGRIILDGVHVSGCRRGVEVEKADELNIWQVFPENVETAVHFEPANVNEVFFGTIERIVRVEKIVERNVPVTKKEIEYVVPPELRKELENCKETVAIVTEKKNDLQNKVYELLKEIEGLKAQKAYPDPWIVLGVLVAGLAAGYLLGRI